MPLQFDGSGIQAAVSFAPSGAPFAVSAWIDAICRNAMTRCATPCIGVAGR